MRKTKIYEKVVDEAEKKSKDEIKFLMSERLKAKGFILKGGVFDFYYPGYPYLKKYEQEDDVNIREDRLGAYIDIPFCSRRCTFCGFSVFEDIKKKEDYIRALTDEFKFYRDKDIKINHLSIGGGTPSMLSTDELTRIVSAFRKNFKIIDNRNLRIEIHPEIAKRRGPEIFLKGLALSGFTSISIGGQTFDNKLLRSLNRGHDSEDIMKTVKTAKKYFKRVNLDILYGTEGQSVESWKDTLIKTLYLEPDEVCCYRLVPNNERYKIDNEYDLTLKTLICINTFIKAGWTQFGNMGSEIVFRREKQEKRFETWLGLKQIGFGTKSLTITRNFQGLNPTTIDEYREKIRKNRIGFKFYRKRTSTDNLIYSLTSNIMMTARIDRKFYIRNFGVDVYTQYPKIISELKSLGLCREHGNQIVLTKMGVIHISKILARFIPEDYKTKHIEFLKNKKSDYEEYKNCSVMDYDF
ncbi:MAG: radical SAM protein [Candidatus Woesearchaeota archaeon]